MMLHKIERSARVAFKSGRNDDLDLKHCIVYANDDESKFFIKNCGEGHRPYHQEVERVNVYATIHKSHGPELVEYVTLEMLDCLINHE